MTVVVVRCSSCGHTAVVALSKYTRIPTPPRIAKVVEKLRTCSKCGKQFESPRVVDMRWSM